MNTFSSKEHKNLLMVMYALIDVSGAPLMGTCVSFEALKLILTFLVIC